jgi:hypothetical protein
MLLSQNFNFSMLIAQNNQIWCIVRIELSHWFEIDFLLIRLLIFLSMKIRWKRRRRRFHQHYKKEVKKIYSAKLMVNPPKYSQHKQQPSTQLLKLLFLSPQIRLIETSVPLRLWCQTQSLLMTLTKLYQWLMCHHRTTEIGWFVVLFEQLMKG